MSLTRRLLIDLEKEKAFSWEFWKVLSISFDWLQELSERCEWCALSTTTTRRCVAPIRSRRSPAKTIRPTSRRPRPSWRPWARPSSTGGRRGGSCRTPSRLNSGKRMRKKERGFGKLRKEKQKLVSWIIHLSRTWVSKLPCQKSKHIREKLTFKVETWS